jgi:hypothetical protein
MRVNQENGPDCAVSDDRLLHQQWGVLTLDEHVHSDSRMAEIHSLREKAVREDITRRLRRVCSNFSDDEFEGLVKLMAARQVKCERRQSW